MKPGVLCAKPSTGATVLVVSSEMVNLSTYPTVLGLRCKAEEGPGYPFTVPIGHGLWAYTMTIAPRDKTDLEPDGRRTDSQAMVNVMNALFRIMRQD
ncbi:hypothetical protein LO763_19940 [Glycomyces sp. A-F 0318]|uniref:hypothetical protein n=1 Tax=Glycomyces amatae TaxID=2881355 RepID=UPI001E6198D5|nr:hypothetical protein [Glycomyces amatae]MCD0445885.1 hypothetical protein [Glycomyces amatae]